MPNEVVKRETPIDEYEKRQKILAEALENINKVSKELVMARPAFKADLQDKLDRMTFNYNQMIEKSCVRMKPLKDSTPMSEEEKIKLKELIESV